MWAVGLRRCQRRQPGPALPLPAGVLGTPRRSRSVREVLSLGSCCGPRNRCPCFCPCPAAICSQCSSQGEHFKSSFRSCAAPLKTLPQLPARLKSRQWLPQPPRVWPALRHPPACCLLPFLPHWPPRCPSNGTRATSSSTALLPLSATSPVCAWPLPPCLLALLACHLLRDACLSFSRPPFLPTSFFLPYPPLPLLCVSLL